MTKTRQINKLQEKSKVLQKQLQRKEHEVKILQNEVDNTEIKIQKRIDEQSEAHAKELKEQNTEHIKQIISLESEIEVQKHLKKNAQKNSSKWKMAFKKRDVNSGNEMEVTELKTRLDDMENENLELKEKIENFLWQKPIETFKEQRYSDNVREVYHYLTAQGISCHKVAPVIRKVVTKLTNEKIERLPKKSLTATMPVEADLLSKMQVGAIPQNEPNSTLHIDGTTKKFSEYGTFNVTTGGTGKSLSLGYVQQCGGSADDYMDSTRNIFFDIAKLSHTYQGLVIKITLFHYMVRE